MAHQDNSFSGKLKRKYRLTIFDDSSFEAIWTTYVSRLQISTLFLTLVIIITAVISLLFVYTPLNLLFPHKADIELQEQALFNRLRIDSLENKLLIYERSYNNFMKILNGEKLDDYVAQNDSIIAYENIDFSKSVHDSILRKQISEEEQFNLALTEEKEPEDIEKMHFFVPVKGMVTNEFNLQEKHFGIDVVAAPNEPILSVLSGTVISSTWTLSTGYVIQLQHENNLISFYKHNSVLLKEVGDHVKAGEPIAIIGNSGELTTGPHLHFELWHNGTPLNPADYITF